MAWYNPISWLEKKAPVLGSLYCDNPECRYKIKGPRVAYNREENEFYHEGDCAVLANSWKAITTGLPQFGNIEYISLEKALRIKKPAGLEEKV